MSLLNLLRALHDFFHVPASPLPLAMFRIAFGLVLLVESVPLLRWGPDLFGSRGVQPSSARRDGTGAHEVARYLFALHSIACACLVVGAFTRLAAGVVFLNFAMRMRRNHRVIQGGDNIAKFMAFLLMFSNAGGVLSVDAALGLSWLGGTGTQQSQWALRLMQVQTSIIYLRAVSGKLRVGDWIRGTAVFHALHPNPHFCRAEFPRIFTYAPLVALATWAVLASEIASGTLVWFRETRLLTLGMAAAMHAGFETMLSLKQFQWFMCANLLLFVNSHEWLWLLGRAGLVSAIDV